MPIICPVSGLHCKELHVVLLKKTVMYPEVLDLTLGSLTKWDLRFSSGRV